MPEATRTPGEIVFEKYLNFQKIPFEFEKVSPKVKKLDRETITGGHEVRYRTVIDTISLANAPNIVVRDPEVDFQEISVDCAVGTRFWYGRRLTVDVSGKLLIVNSK